MEEGSAIFFGGGVDGGCMRDLGGFAGDGDVARKSSKSAPSSPDFPFLLSFERRPRLPLLRFDVGVRGGDDWILNECAGKASSSSSEGAAKLVACALWKCEEPR